MEVEARVADPDEDADRRQFLAGLVPLRPVPGGWQYRCRHFTRDDAGLGGCAICECRPVVCHGFPYGEVVRGWRECAWYVDVRDEQGNALRVVPPITDETPPDSRSSPASDRNQEDE